MKTLALNDRETATVLHALRKLVDPANCNYACDHFDDVEPLTDDEIESLCERLNFSDVAAKAPASPAPVNPAHDGLALPEDVRDFLANLSYRAADETPRSIAEDACDLLGRYDEDAHKENLLDRARALQTEFWDCLRDLEEALGDIEIDSNRDLEGMTIADLIEEDCEEEN